MMQPSLFEGSRAQMSDSIRAALESLSTYGPSHDHWAIAWSGGKDSTALLTFVIWAVLAGKVQRPRSITVLYADTRLEIPPLWYAARTIREELEVAAEDLADVGVDLRVEVVMAPLDDRFWVYMLGHGVPPPTNQFRWCTQRIKVDPMAEVVERLAAQLETKFLLLTGLRKGESAARDDRIAVACSRDDGECGQGWFQLSLPDAACDKLAPILEWRTCHVWRWLRDWAPKAEFGDWSTELIADAYGGEQAEDLAARTGCIDCNLVEEDRAMKICARLPGWEHLQLLAGRLKEVYGELRMPRSRLRQPAGERRADGTLALNQQRLGPLKLAVRRWALDRVLAIQAAVNDAARAAGRPEIDILNAEETARIRWAIDLGERATQADRIATADADKIRDRAAKGAPLPALAVEYGIDETTAAALVHAWPAGWRGVEPGGEAMADRQFANGMVQPLLGGMFK